MNELQEQKVLYLANLLLKIYTERAVWTQSWMTNNKLSNFTNEYPGMDKWLTGTFEAKIAEALQNKYQDTTVYGFLSDKDLQFKDILDMLMATTNSNTSIKEIYKAIKLLEDKRIYRITIDHMSTTKINVTCLKSNLKISGAEIGINDSKNYALLKSVQKMRAENQQLRKVNEEISESFHTLKTTYENQDAMVNNRASFNWS
jgi:hypothetical protein